MARGKLVDKCRNIIYKCGDKHYVRKRKNENRTSDESQEKIFAKGTSIKSSINNEIFV